MRYFQLAILWVVAINIFLGCSSTGTKESDEKDSGYGQGDAEVVSSSQKSGATSALATESLPTKNELYDGIKIALEGGSDTAVEKAVANVLSQDQSDAKALNGLALYHLSKNRTQMAKMIFKSILDKDPKNTAALNNMGVLHSQIGERRQATEYFRKALSLNSGYPIANANLGSILAMGKDYSKAKKYLEIAYDGGIKDLAVLNNYATALMAEGDSDAKDVFKEALQLGGSDFNVTFNYALYLTYVKKDYKEATEVLDKIRFLGMPPQKKNIVLKMEETISGRGSEETKTQ